MIRPPGFRGAAFTSVVEGDVRKRASARKRVADHLTIPGEWAAARQVHGIGVIRADRPGLLGEGDALFTTRPGLPVSVATADCVGVVVEADGAVGVVHAGWRGAAAGVVGELRRAMEKAGHPPLRAAIGPSIGPCCYEVGPEVAGRFPGRTGETTWGTVSVDLWGAVEDALEGVSVWRADRCTHCDEGFFSYRRDGTGGRQVAVGWLPG